MIEMVSADGERVAVAAEDEYMQIGPAQRDPAGEWQGAAVDVMHTVRLDEIRETARATNARNGGDVFMPKLALFDQLEIKRENGKVAATGAPGGMVGGQLLFAQRLAVA